MFTLCELEMRWRILDDVALRSYVNETSWIELRELCFHVDGNGLAKPCEGVLIIVSSIGGRFCMYEASTASVHQKCNYVLY